MYHHLLRKVKDHDFKQPIILTSHIVNTQCLIQYVNYKKLNYLSYEFLNQILYTCCTIMDNYTITSNGKILRFSDNFDKPIGTYHKIMKDVEVLIYVVFGLFYFIFVECMYFNKKCVSVCVCVCTHARAHTHTHTHTCY